MLTLKETNHKYHCSENNFYVGNQEDENCGRSEYETWKEFKKAWLDEDGTIDCDYNLCFRYDILQNRNSETDEPIEGYSLWLFFIFQRKGIYKPVLIRSLIESDMEELDKFLKLQWAYMKSQWSEFN